MIRKSCWWPCIFRVADAFAAIEHHKPALPLECSQSHEEDSRFRDAMFRIGAF